MESGEIVLRNIVAEVVEQQEWVKLGSASEPESAAKMHSGAFASWLGFDQPLYGTNRHV